MPGKLIKLLSLTLVFFLSACAQTQYSSPEKVEAALMSKSAVIDKYRIGPSDVVLINVWRNSELSTSVPVRPDGRISVPLIGDIKAAGKEPEKLAQDISVALSNFIREPKVSVVITSMGSHEFVGRVRVTGAVRNPLSTPYREGMTVLDVVLAAGGLNQFAAPSESALYRKLKGEVVAIPVDLESILLKGNITTNYELHPGDIITIPEKNF